ncbi:hypothetical protein IB639_09620 [Francisella tularensis subsp. tularensis]|nr:hypothetical protein [Francisella tularensis]MBK2041677.1 hypothetical protein [Francisella tularensis subsp. tularensis]MBK2041680.1 hypothetical protein [Francisella tularensis subsp. tularensis]MCF5906941.1 hypothetical protein [Francisella tularensis]MCH4979202.1 hypothetical protein [Francisella tularensis]UJM47851.1 hypothetical protein LVB09_05680 [Francisella tularensis]
MMAFLLDIITFLQISFSTNIFRINYIYKQTNLKRGDWYYFISKVLVDLSKG